MRILRLLATGCLAALSIVTIAFVSADRLNHMAPPKVARAVIVEPSATGSIAVPRPVADGSTRAAPAKVAPAKIPNGFDTERLNALMRGDPILPGRR